MNAEQRKPVHVLLQLFRMNFPALWAMTLLAIRTELTAVNVGVAVFAVRARFRKNQAGVALRAADLFVHSEQRILRAIMIEFRRPAHWFPT